MKKSTKEEFIAKAKKIHGEKYDYSNVEYINSSTKVCITCPKHGNFFTTPNAHISQHQGCKICGNAKKGQFRKITQDEFIDKAKKIHGNKYNYSKVNYVNSQTKVIIICPEHGEFLQKPNAHLNGNGCPYCGGSIRHTNESFIEKAKSIHGDKYDYSDVDYINNKTKVKIFCKSCNKYFYQTPHEHLSGYGCLYCAGFGRTTDEFIELAKKVHGNTFDYKNVIYHKMFEKVSITCKTHGDFLQTPASHLQGAGCPYCNESHLEKEIRILLTENNIHFEQQKQFDWLKRQTVDFYLPEYNVAIECQGSQHFMQKFNPKQISFEPLEVIQNRDNKKLVLCQENNIRLYYYSNLNIKYPYKVYTDKNLLLNNIINGNDI